jgi:hypothetical protein
MTDLDTEIERLQSEATERWGEKWTIEIRRFADGDAQANAVQSRGLNDDRHLVKDHLFILESGEVVVERVTVERRELETETIEAPDEIDTTS